jgi:hypothetical protein
VDDAQGAHGRGELTSAVVGQRITRCTLEVRQGCRDDLTLLAEGAREDVDVVAACHVVGQGHSGREGLVIRVGVHEEQPGALPSDRHVVEKTSHWATAMSANSTTPPAMVLADRLRTSDPATYSARRSARPM